MYSSRIRPICSAVRLSFAFMCMVLPRNVDFRAAMSLHPKPICWPEIFRSAAVGTHRRAVRRFFLFVCYPELVEGALADYILERGERRSLMIDESSTVQIRQEDIPLTAEQRKRLEDQTMENRYVWFKNKGLPGRKLMGKVVQEVY